MNGPLVLGAIGGLVVAAAAAPLYFILSPGDGPYDPERDETYGGPHARAKIEGLFAEMQRLLVVEIAGAAMLGTALVWQASTA